MTELNALSAVVFAHAAHDQIPEDVRFLYGNLTARKVTPWTVADQRLHVVVGPCAVGKSTLVKNSPYTDNNTVVIEPDMIREELGLGDDVTLSGLTRAKDTTYYLINRAHAAGFNLTVVTLPYSSLPYDLVAAAPLSALPLTVDLVMAPLNVCIQSAIKRIDSDTQPDDIAAHICHSHKAMLDAILLLTKRVETINFLWRDSATTAPKVVGKFSGKDALEVLDAEGIRKYLAEFKLNDWLLEKLRQPYRNTPEPVASSLRINLV